MDAERLADDLMEAFETAVPVPPLTDAHPGLTVEEAYAIQRALIDRHRAAGRTVAGRKIGLTSEAIQRQFNVDSPDFGVVLDTHTFRPDQTLSRSALNMLLPRLEAEVAFVLAEPLAGPGVTTDSVLAVTAAVLPVFEVIDSRIEGWRITLADTIADNASCLGAVLGAQVPLDRAGPLDELHVRITRDGEQIESGRGSAVMGHPAAAVAWLANQLGELGDALPPGQPVLSGSFTAAFDAVPGRYVADFGDGLGSVATVIVP